MTPSCGLSRTSVSQPASQSICPSVSQSVRTSVSVPVGQTVKQLVSEAVRPFLHPSVSQPTVMSVSNSVRPSGSHSVNQLNQSVRPSVRSPSVRQSVTHSVGLSVRQLGIARFDLAQDKHCVEQHGADLQSP